MFIGNEMSSSGKGPCRPAWAIREYCTLTTTPATEYPITSKVQEVPISDGKCTEVHFRKPSGHFMAINAHIWQGKPA